MLHLLKINCIKIDMKNFLAISILAFLLLSCSGSDSEGENNVETIINPITFDTLSSNSPYAFIEEKILVSVDASGYESINVTSDNSNISITKINNITYNIEASEALEATIDVVLLSGDFEEIKSIDLEFFEHGTSDGLVVEGLYVDVDSSEKAEKLIGEPDVVVSGEDLDKETWFYFDKGFWVGIDTSNNKVDYFRFYGYDGWTRTINNELYEGVSYPYEIGGGLKIDNEQLTINKVIETFGSNPTEKNSDLETNRHYYRYSNIQSVFYFFSESIDETNNKIVPYVDIY